MRKAHAERRPVRYADISWHDGQSPTDSNHGAIIQGYAWVLGPVRKTLFFEAFYHHQQCAQTHLTSNKHMIITVALKSKTPLLFSALSLERTQVEQSILYRCG